MDAEGIYQAPTVGKHKALDFYLDDEARLMDVDSFHHGHVICATVDAAIDGYRINEDALDHWIVERYVDSRNTHASFARGYATTGLIYGTTRSC